MAENYVKRVTIELAGDTPIYEAENGGWCRYRDVEALLGWVDEQVANAEAGFAEGQRTGNPNMAAANAQRMIDMGEVRERLGG